MNYLVFLNKAIKTCIPEPNEPAVEFVIFNDCKYENLSLEKKYVRKIRFYCDEIVCYFFINGVPFEVKNNILDFEDYMICSQYLGESILKIEVTNYTSPNINKTTVGFY
jgi:hypothetical protein